jgi:hypothetical protein
MANQLPMKLTKTQLDEFTALLGSAPVLSTESEKHYNEVWDGLLSSFTPHDFMELFFIRQVQNETWKIQRYTRHQTLAIERRFRESAEFQAKRRKEQVERRQALAKELAEKTGRPITELSQMVRFADLIGSSVADVDELAERTPKEFDHNRALEAGILFQEQLDRLINAALARRNDALDQLELYRDGLGQRWRQISDEIIDAVATEIKAGEKQIEPPSLAPEHPKPSASGEVASPTNSGGKGA